MKKVALSVLAASLMAGVSAPAFAKAGDVLARFRVINVNPTESTNNGAAAGVGLGLSQLNTGVKDATVPEVDFTYMITDNIGAELILGTSRHSVNTKLGGVGKVSVLPPTVTLQYHFAPEATFRPYAGVGLNYTRFYDVDLKAPVSKLDVKKNSFGFALQAGFDYALNKDVFLNVDVKKIAIKTDVKATDAAGLNLGELKLDPWVVGVGVGMKF